MRLAVRTVVMPPCPVGATISSREVVILDVRVVSLDDPVIVVTDFGLVPDVVIPVIGIVDAITDADVSRAAG
jgi:hypothetical protein